MSTVIFRIRVTQTRLANLCWPGSITGLFLALTLTACGGATAPEPTDASVETPGSTNPTEQPVSNPTPDQSPQGIPDSPANVSKKALQPAAGGDQLVVAEAERADITAPIDTHEWQLISLIGDLGAAAMQALPNLGVEIEDPDAAPRMDYLINFKETGTYYVWIRGSAASAQDDSLNVGLDGRFLETASHISFFTTTPSWSNRRVENTVAQINVSTTGAHYINVWMREDGLVIDKILLIKNSSFVPTGAGPGQSQKTPAIVATPYISPPGQMVSNAVEVSIVTATPNASILYTLDASDPQTSGFPYNGPFLVATDAIIRAMATAPNFEPSAHATATFTFGECKPTRVMPLGDSITLGSATVTSEGDFVGYRRKLYIDLSAAGYAVDFVGGEDNGRGATTGEVFDTQHEGHGGVKGEDVALAIHDWLVANPAEVVLLHIGTNDIAGSPQNTSVSDIEVILNEIDRFDPSVTVVLARIVNQLNNNGQPRFTVKQFNKNIQALADERVDSGDKIVVVDLETALDYDVDLADDLHPNIQGYNKMADRWFSALTSFIPSCAN